MSRTYERFCELLSAYNETDEKWMPIQKAHELLGSVNEDEIWEQRHAAADALFTYIAELEAERRWIPVSERLPEANTPVLTISKDNNEPVTAWLEDDFWWSSVDWSLSVTHWMPIPKLPEVQE